MASEYSDEIKEIQNELQAYRPGSTVKNPGPVKFPDTLCIGLFGRTGCGKTSLINSMRFAAKGRLRKAQWLASAGHEMAGGHTMYRKCVEITKSIKVVDNRGIDKLQAHKAVTELIAQIAGDRGYSTKVAWDGSDGDHGEEIGDKLNTAVFVFSAQHNIDENINGLDSVISVMHTALGQYPVAVITHVDEATTDEVEEVKAVLRSQGVSDTCIFTVANVTPNNETLKEEYQATMLNLFDRCMIDGDQSMIFRHHKKFEDEQLALLNPIQNSSTVVCKIL